MEVIRHWLNDYAMSSRLNRFIRTDMNIMAMVSTINKLPYHDQLTLRRCFLRSSQRICWIHELSYSILFMNWKYGNKKYGGSFEAMFRRNPHQHSNTTHYFSHWVCSVLIVLILNVVINSHRDACIIFCEQMGTCCVTSRSHGEIRWTTIINWLRYVSHAFQWVYNRSLISMHPTLFLLFSKLIPHFD